MIASFKHGFIFIKTRKTAGSSIEFALSPYCGPQDIVAPIGPSEDRDRFQATGVLPANFSPDKAYEAKYVAALRRGNKKQIRALILQSPAHGACQAHESAEDIRGRVPAEFWKRAFKFTAERHPYEKVLSLAWFRYREGRSPPFEEHLDSVIRTMIRDYQGWHLYSIGGISAVNRVIRHETLQPDLDAACTYLGLPQLKLPFRRAHTRKDRRPARDVLTDGQKAFIRDACRDEFAMFGWEP